MRALYAAAFLSGAGIVAGGAYAMRGTPVAYRVDDPPRALTECRSALASMEAALYVADQQACLNVGVLRPVPPPTKRGRK